MDAAIIAAVISGLVSFAGTVLSLRERSRAGKQRAQDTRLDEIQRERDSASVHMFKLIDELQGEVARDHKRLAEADAIETQIRALYRGTLDRNDALEQQHRLDLVRISDLEAEVKSLRR